MCAQETACVWCRRKASLSLTESCSVRQGVAGTESIATALDEVLAALGRSRAVVMGKSWGGKNAAVYAASRGVDKVIKLVRKPSSSGYPYSNYSSYSRSVLKFPIHVHVLEFTF